MAFLKKLTKALRAWSRLPILEKLLAIEAWGDLLVVSILLRTPFQRHLMRQSPRFKPRNSRFQPAHVIELVNAVALVHIKKMTCLERAVVAKRALQRRGADVTLQIGVRPSSGQLEAHAWLEQDGKPFDESAKRYSILRKPTV